MSAGLLAVHLRGAILNFRKAAALQCPTVFGKAVNDGFYFAHLPFSIA